MADDEDINDVIDVICIEYANELLQEYNQVETFATFMIQENTYADWDNLKDRLVNNNLDRDFKKQFWNAYYGNDMDHRVLSIEEWLLCQCMSILSELANLCNCGHCEGEYRRATCVFDKKCNEIADENGVCPDWVDNMLYYAFCGRLITLVSNLTN